MISCSPQIPIKWMQNEPAESQGSKHNLQLCRPESTNLRLSRPKRKNAEVGAVFSNDVYPRCDICTCSHPRGPIRSQFAQVTGELIISAKWSITTKALQLQSKLLGCWPAGSQGCLTKLVQAKSCRSFQLRHLPSSLGHGRDWLAKQAPAARAERNI